LVEHFADRLLAAIEAKGAAVCVGIDPVYERLPGALRSGGDDPDRRLEAVAAFCRRVLELVAPIAAAVKPQIAHFELYRAGGVALYFDVVRRAKELGLIVIGDVKRGDIGSTARAYAAAHLAGEAAPDAVTVNGYFGRDSVEPFLDVAREEGKGLFVLVRTSNPSAAAIQDFTAADGRRFYEHVAEQVAVAGAAEGLVGRSGFSCLGAVVGATYPQEARRLRQIMPRQILLVPGYGAQGATAADCAAAFAPDGTGAIVNASRSVIYAYQQGPAGGDWREAIVSAARAFAEDIRSAVTP
jgi:orotidine-5'-phosphate decarboxylase